MKINISKTEEIEKALKRAQSGCSARLFQQKQIVGIVIDAEKKLVTIGIPKKYWAGCTILCDAGKVANSYKYTPEGTYVTLRRFSSDWFLTTATRQQVGSCPHGRNERETLTLSELAHANLPNAYSL